ncbi:ribosome maturation factor RimM [Schaalia sp. lx-260]|uniref:ribosome maturation factor RimM n=1 Tax=Schaalia sp. lx-260 TaxID=2899082 RepID=UPI001E2F6E3F|nr:ribosome maturation factor RimM [Schaalia sp. lx-260]MCD4549307.1 ribosome maturation factor RimM [Schaalia sp. lx-260]
MQMTAARIGPPHGLRGEVFLEIRTDDADIVVIGATFTTDHTQWPTLTIESLRRSKNRVIAAFHEILTREDAEKVRGTALLIEEHAEENAWYPHQLKGLKAVNTHGQELGTVTGIHTGAAQDLLLVRTGRGTVMVPFVKQLVPTIDLEAEQIIIDPPGGLFDDEVIDGPDGGNGYAL